MTTSTSARTAALAIEGVSVTSGDVQALTKVTLNLESGVTALLRPNGPGKRRCSALLQGFSRPTRERHALTNNTTIQSITGTVTITTETDNETETLRANDWQEPPNNVRYEYVAGPSERTTLVSNGSTF